MKYGYVYTKRVENMLSPKGNKISNQFKIFEGNAIYFKSYGMVIAGLNKRTGFVEFFNDLNYSNTTRKYLYQFLRECKRYDLCNRKKLDKAIKSGRKKIVVFNYSPEL